MAHNTFETWPLGTISRRQARVPAAQSFLWLCVFVAGPMAGTAQGAGPVSLKASAPNGANGSFETFEAGKTGGNGGYLAELSYTFTEALTSTVANTPAFSLWRSGGSGGNGGSSACCNGGSGGAGGDPGVASIFGPATLTTTSTSSPGFLARLITGSGGNGGDSGTCCKGGDGGVGALDGAGWLTVSTSATTDPTAQWSISTSAADSPAFQATSYAGNGGRGGTGASEGSSGGTGGAALAIRVGVLDPDDGFASPFVLDAQTLGTQSPGISIALSPMDGGGPTGNGGQGGADDTADGGRGGTGGTPFVSSLVLGSSSIRTSGSSSPGIVGLSQGGTGGKGGTGKSFGDGGAGGTGGGGGSFDVYLYDQNTIATKGESSHGIAVYSLGGNGGQTGDGSWLSNPGPPGAAAASGPVTVDLSQSTATTISTQGDNAFGILAQSIGGHGGSASSSYGLVDFAVSGGSAGNGGEVTINNGLGNVPAAAVPAAVSTAGQSSPAIGAYSLGGGGGQGGTAFGAFYAGGGSGGAGGAGESVTVMNAGALTTKNYASDGILALSIGGAGGSGGSTAALASVGGRAGPASNGGSVVVQNVGVIQTGTAPDATAESGVCAGCSLGILAQSIGGGGGKAGSSAGWFDLGGTGGGGGSGGEVVVANAGSISTALDQSPAIVGQSIGGGGGNGGGAAGGGVIFSASIGGSGGGGGSASSVLVATGAPSDASADALIQTSGQSSDGLVAQSIGGGGGNGGYAVSASASVATPSIALALGGGSAPGGSGGVVTVETFDYSASYQAGIDTKGDVSHGLVAQSIGGGGGHGGAAIAAAVAVGESGAGGITIGVGGRSGNGGAGATVSVTNGIGIGTEGVGSAGIVAQSIGGGGGDGGLAVAANASVGSAGVDVGLGGTGGSGGSAEAVTLSSTGEMIATLQDHAEGVLVQSVGGGGGRGALAVSAGLSTTGELNLGLGGGGAPGGAGGNLSIALANAVTTGSTVDGVVRGQQSPAVIAQSIGGGGGNGGMSVSASGSSSNTVALGISIGGAGGSGVGAGSVTAAISGKLSTQGELSPGLLAQSIGGGGGNGGTSIAGSLSTSSSKALNVGIGGNGASAASGGSLSLSIADIVTAGQQSDGVLAQSIGGSGGSGGTSIAGSVASSSSTAIAVAVGGQAKSAGAGKSVTLDSNGDVTVTGDGSRGLVAQSIGGGGGHGGTAVTGAFTNSSSTKDLSLGIGGAAGGGGTGGVVTLTSRGSIATGSSADLAAGLTGEHGILAQSIGGGGGSGGLSASADTNLGNRSLTVDIGGGGGSGATSSAVQVSNSAAIQTQGYVSHGILAQSIAGGGGDGGGTLNFGVSSSSSKGFGVSVGGTGGGGASSNTVTVALGSGSAIETTGLGSRGIVGQSIAGGGGNGGGNIFKNQSGANDPDQLSVAVGGAGGVASNAGAVVLATTAAMSVTTGSGNPSTSDAGSVYQGHGVQLQSIGGGGGNGAAGIQGAVKPSSTQGAIDIGVGGKGTGGGSGGAVTAGTTAAPLLGSIATGDYSSYGLFAQSIGGGGGAGASGVLGDVTNNAAKGLTIGVGGSGGSGGAGGTVSVVSNAVIDTDGDGSKGLVAQSIGGGGGAGAQGIQGNVSGASDSGTKQITFGLGGSGGGGGSGGAVTLTNGGAISTGLEASGGSVFDQMDAILAQSIGGGGGIGGLGIAGNIANSSQATAMSLTLGIGEAGGGAGSGALVKVANSGALSVAGNGSHGIVAQSIGGGGGTAGAGIAGNITAPSDASSDYQVDFGLGGKAGGGGTGGQVQVTNSGSIQTAFAPLGDSGAGDQAAGILAQSIGGGGGAGGIGISGDITGSKNSKALNLAIGGAGGSGGSAAQGSGVDSVSDAGVGVSNSGRIGTVGDGTMGIVAQSIGGGGGNGAVGFAGTVASGDGKSLTLGVGAIGGSGGQSGIVYVANTGTIQTGTSAIAGDSAVSQAHAIFAQSVGGGGGAGMHTGSLVYGSTAATGTEHGIALSVGGTAAGGDGGAVRVDTGSNRSNTITTYNLASHGVLAQSIGGGGGLAGDLGGIGTQEASDQWEAAIAIGGSSSSGSAGAVTINHEAASVTTHGDGAVGLLAQSIGGGGGIGGDAAGLQNTGDTSQTTKNANIAINIGATGSQGGNGGQVTITADGAVTTNGIGATAIFGQSVGAGGGVGGVGASGLSGTVTLGGTGTASGDGGSVTITANGDISTGFGSGGPVIASHGILAQSIGGGGGYGGNVQTTYPDLAPVPQNSAAADNAFAQGASGNGGDVTVKATGNIRTTGGSSAAILAQSVGGGGGIAGTAGNAFYEDGWLGARIGSAGGGGAGGTVSVTYAPTAGQQIHTSGVAAHGIFAQSAGGAAASTVSATKTSVTVAGPILTSGLGSFGVYAESSGQGTGAIDVTVTSTGSVTGGASGSQGVSGPLTGAGIVMRGGTASNVLNNAGTIATVDGVNGIAVDYIGSGTLTVTNNGTITGQVLKASSVDLLNGPTGLVNAGPLLDVDTFINQGTLAPGGAGRAGTTRLTGDLTQDGGVLAVDLDPNGAGATDHLSVGGRARLGGKVAVSLLDTWQPRPGAQSAPILDADGGLSLEGLSVIRSAVAQYRLEQPKAGILHLGYDIDFANPGILAATNDNQDGISRYLHAIYRARALDEDIARALIAIEDGTSYARVMNSLSAEVAVDNQIASLLSGLRFNDDLLGCRGRSWDQPFLGDGRCGWLRLGGQRLEQHETGDNLGFDEDSLQLAGGGQVDIGSGWTFGAALSYENGTLNADDSNAGSDAERYQAGLFAKRRFGATELSGALAIGYGDYDIGRNPWPGEHIDGTQKLWLYSAQLRAAHQMSSGRWTFIPRIDLGLDYLSMGGFTESGSNAFRIRHDGQSDTYVNVQPAIDILTEFETHDGTLVRPRLTLGITQFLGNAAPSVSGRFAAAPAAVAPFSASTELDKTRLDAAAGVDVLARRNLVVRADVFGSFSDNSESYGGALSIEMAF